LVPAPAEALMLKQLVASTKSNSRMKAGLGFRGRFFEVKHLLHW
jgi:hypothetical protein